MTTSVLTVSDLVGTVGTVAETGGVAEDTLDDASDATYVKLTTTAAATAEATFSLGTFTLGTGRLKSWFVSARAQDGLVASRQSQVNFYLKSTTRSDLGSISQGTTGTALPTGSFGTLTTAPQVPPTLAQADIDALQVVLFKETGEGVSNGETLFAELSVSVTYAAIPVANVTYPTATPALTTSSFAVTWTHTAGSDGGAQTYAHVKVFTAAQYGAGGFDATTSTAHYDSGIVTTSANSHTVGPLDNSTTYRAYVRTAQSINGSAHWSAFDFEAFTTSYAVSTVSSVTAVATSATGIMTVTVARSTGTEAWASVEVERTDDAGSTWVPVRGATNPAVTETNTFVTTFTTNSMVVVDYEAGNGTTVTYRARATTGTPVAVGAWTSSSATASWTSAAVWLKDPLAPSLNVSIRIVEQPQPTRTLSQGVFNVIGATYPVVVSDVRRARFGTFVAQTTTLATGQTFDAALANSVKLLQFPSTHQWGSKYIALGDTQEMVYVHVVERFYRMWQISYNQIALPADETEY